MFHVFSSQPIDYEHAIEIWDVENFFLTILIDHYSRDHGPLAFYQFFRLVNAFLVRASKMQVFNVNTHFMQCVFCTCLKDAYHYYSSNAAASFEEMSWKLRPDADVLQHCGSDFVEHLHQQASKFKAFQ